MDLKQLETWLDLKPDNSTLEQTLDLTWIDLGPASENLKHHNHNSILKSTTLTFDFISLSVAYQCSLVQSRGILSVQWLMLTETVMNLQSNISKSQQLHESQIFLSIFPTIRSKCLVKYSPQVLRVNLRCSNCQCTTWYLNYCTELVPAFPLNYNWLRNLIPMLKPIYSLYHS